MGFFFGGEGWEDKIQVEMIVHTSFLLFFNELDLNLVGFFFHVVP